MIDYVLYGDLQNKTITPKEDCNATILVVDDEPRMCDSLKGLLELNGYQCVTASGGGKAIRCLQQRPFDLVLLDLKMPQIDGHQVLQYIKEHHPHTNVIVLTGAAALDDAIRVLQQGAHDLLRKPYATAELLHSIENSMRKQQLERENLLMQKRLASSEQRYRFFVDSSPDIIYMLDKNGCFRFVNDRIVGLLGYSKEELIGEHYSKIIFQEDIEKADFAFDINRTEQDFTHQIELRVVRKSDGAPASPYGSRPITVELNSMGIHEEMHPNPGGGFAGSFGVIRDISERKRAEETINYQLYHDVLTSLPNRALFWDRLETALSRAKRSGQLLAVMVLDLDGFKIINDSLGHITGDKLLQAVAQRLRRCLRQSDTLARVGGDEFNLLLPEIGCREDAARTAAKMIETMKAPFLLEGNEIFIGLSIGIALYSDDGENMETLVKNADMAMYHIKGRGKNGYEFFSGSMMSRVSRHFSLESGLRKALSENQFVLQYQPQIDIGSGEIAGVESLIRWRHPQEGLIPPGDFIPLAEETGLITDIGEWVLRSACADHRRWRRAGINGVRISVNVCAAQLYRADFVETVLGILHENRMPGELLELEITENALMRDIEHVVQKLRQLTYFGVRIAVDDFGTGYSSLGYLQALPLTTLKLDRAFVNRIESLHEQHSIITAVVAMGKGLGLNVIAEGVETEVQLEYLRSIGCPQAQGFLLGSPVFADGIMKEFPAADGMSQCLPGYGGFRVA
ncbi:MAG TPA: EAL domain-containing protein [Sedimenticola sp.]|nr:EAL domain-containing protein [Sedimenticola sp.]